MKRHSGKLLTPRPSAFAAWTAFVRRTVERIGGVKVAVVPDADAPPAKPRARRQSKLTTKSSARVKR